jgi:hypothetical protein
MAITEAYTENALIGSTEYSLTNDSTTIAAQTADGVYQVFIDTGNMAAGDQFRIKIKEKVYSGGTQRDIYAAVLTGAMTDNWVSPSLILMHGWDVTIQKLAGTDRTFYWSIRKVA